jgi:LmbE family N-acetylglucosaminyl deacetylase
MPHTEWDAACGFAAGDDVVGARRDEDRHALGVLAARPIWLDFVDDQYGASASTEAITEALDALIASEAPDAVYMPLGLFHADHVRASDAALVLVSRHRELRWFVYEDAIYRRIDGLVRQRREQLRRAGFELRRVRSAIVDDAAMRKRAALDCYVSQLRGLGSRGGYDDAFGGEVYWRIGIRANA